MLTVPRRPLLLAALLPLARPASAADAATAVIEGFHATLLDVMRNARTLGIRGREQRLRPALQSAFDLATMTRLAIGQPWTQLSPEDRQRLVQAFGDWSIATYANRFDGFDGESFRTAGEAPLENNERLVRTELVRRNDEPVQLNYRMRDVGGAWRVIDIYLSGTISELASRRADFAALLRDGGAGRLEAELKRRTAELQRG